MKRIPYKLNQRAQREWDKYLFRLRGQRELEEKKLLAAAKQKLPELKELLANQSSHWGYEDPIYRFYHHSFKLQRLKTRTLEIVTALQALAPHLRLNLDFLQIIAEGTGNGFGVFKTVSSPPDDRVVVEAFFHARHMLAMGCKYFEELTEPPPVLPSGWATVLYLYNIR